MKVRSVELASENANPKLNPTPDGLVVVVMLVMEVVEEAWKSVVVTDEVAESVLLEIVPDWLVSVAVSIEVCPLDVAATTSEVVAADVDVVTDVSFDAAGPDAG